MYAVTGMTGQVGGAVASRLLGYGERVRAIVRDPTRAENWAVRGCEVVAANLTDAAALKAAFRGVEAIFIVIPPIFDPLPGFPEVRAVIAALNDALREGGPTRVVCLSTIGAQAVEPNLLSQLGLVEQALGALPIPIAFLRAAWFMENAAGDVEAARSGVIPSFLQPLDKPVPMVATADIGRVAAGLLRETWQGRRVIELEGEHRITPNAVAAAFAKALGHTVRMEAVPRETWEASFRAAGARNPEPRARMLDGFNAGWIEFEAGQAGSRKGTTDLDAVVSQLVARS